MQIRKIKRKTQKRPSSLPAEESCRPVPLTRMKAEPRENNLNDNKQTLGRQHLFCILGAESALATRGLTQMCGVTTAPSTAWFEMVSPRAGPGRRALTALGESPVSWSPLQMWDPKPAEVWGVFPLAGAACGACPSPPPAIHDLLSTVWCVRRACVLLPVTSRRSVASRWAAAACSRLRRSARAVSRNYARQFWSEMK